MHTWEGPRATSFPRTHIATNHSASSLVDPRNATRYQDYENANGSNCCLGTRRMTLQESMNSNTILEQINPGASEPDDGEDSLLDLPSEDDFESLESIRLRGAPRSLSPYGIQSVHPQKLTMKRQRKQKTAAGALGGMVVGSLTLGPVGVLVGAAAGAVASNKFCKVRERQAQRRYEQNSFHHGADQSDIHHAFFA